MKILFLLFSPSRDFEICIFRRARRLRSLKSYQFGISKCETECLLFSRMPVDRVRIILLSHFVIYLPWQNRFNDVETFTF